MQVLLALTAHIPLNNLNAWERKIGWELHAVAPECLSWLDLCNSSGYKRERFLRAVAGAAPDRFFFALALRRLNDWVPQVRAAARQCLVALAGRTLPEHVADALWATFTHASTWGRMAAVDRQVLADLTAIPDVARTLKQRILSATEGPATTVFSQISRSPVLDPWLDEIAQNARQPAVRAKACRFLLERRVVWVAERRWKWTELKWCKGRFEPVFDERPLTGPDDFLAQLQRASLDASAMVRRVAAELLIQHLEAAGEQAVTLAERLAADCFPSVAERGRFALERLGRSSAPGNISPKLQ